MSSALGQLPEFGAGLGLTSRANTNGGIGDLDDDLEFLLGDNSKSKSTRGRSKSQPKQSTSKSVISNGEDVYGQMAALANKDFDSDGDDAEPFTEADSKKLADSVNLDDMDANLFGSFSRGQGQKRRQTGSQKASSTSRLSKKDGGSVEGETLSKNESVIQSGGKMKDLSLKGLERTAGTKSALKGTIAEKPKEKKSFGFDDDDLLDLLSDSGDEDLAPKKREKPKIQLTPKPRSATPTAAAATTSCPSLAKDDGKPITSKSSADDSNRTDEIERPRTSRGKQKITDDLSNSPQLLATAETRLLPPGPSRKEVLKLDNSLTAGSLNGTQVDFGDAGDDLLSGMGLDDSDVIGGSLKPGVHISKSERRGSVLDELLGTKGSSTKTTENKMKERSKESDDHDGDAFQFGDYLPSAAADSAVSTTPTRTNKSNLKLPSGRRGSSEHSDILTSRPGSAPALAKKSVRFADTVETSERPSSSPANSEVARTTPSSGSGSGKSSSSSAVAAASSDVDAATSQGSDGSRKPPLPKRSASAIDSGRNKEVHSVDGSGGSVESVPKEEEPRDEMDNELMGNEIDAQSQIVASDRLIGLFPSEENTPKKAPVRGRGRRTSHTTPAASSLFEEDHEEPQTKADMDSGLAGGGSLLVKKEGVSEVIKTEEKKLERPVFPWQKSRQTRSQSLGSVGAVDSAAPHLPAKRLGITTTSAGDRDPSADPSSQLASFQEMLLQQQKQMQEQFALSLQNQMGRSPAAASTLTSAEEEKLKGEVKSLEERIKELTSQLQVEKSELQEEVGKLKQQLESAEGERRRLEAEAKGHREMVSELEAGHQKAQLELSNQIEELKMKLHRVELEKTQLQYSVESGSSRHTEEVEAIQRSHEARIKAMEESIQRRETKWREEVESEALRHQEKMQQMEREKTDAVLALKKRIDIMEVSKTNEISRLQDIHRNSIEDLKHEHEQDKHHLLSMHRQEVEAIKAAHSHTRMLSELTHQVETSTREVSQLQAKLEQAHTMRVEEQTQRAKIHQEQLKTLEERLLKQQAENSAERERLHLLISKLESHIAQQSKSIEQEKWQLQQDSSRLKTQQSAFEEERATFLSKMEEDREQLQRAREKFLIEQREVMSKCYEERKSVSAERAEVEAMKRNLRERELRESQKNQRIEAELEASRSHIREESDRICRETAKLRQEQLRLKTESETTAKEKERLEALEKDVEQRSQEAKNLCQSALSIKEKGEHALREAEKMKGTLESRSKCVDHQLLELREKEKRVATEHLSLVRLKRERDLHTDPPDDVQSCSSESNASSSVPQLHQTLPTTESVTTSTGQGNTTALPPISHHQASLSSLDLPPLLSTSTPRPQQSIPLKHHHYPPLPPPRGTTPIYQSSLLPHVQLSAVQHNSKYSSSSKRYSPSSSPVRSQQPVVMGVGLGRLLTSELAQIEHTRNLRQLALLAEQDYQDLEEESRFLKSLKNSGTGHFHDSMASITTKE